MLRYYGVSASTSKSKSSVGFIERGVEVVLNGTPLVSTSESSESRFNFDLTERGVGGTNGR